MGHYQMEDNYAHDVVVWEAGIEVYYARESRSIAGIADEKWQAGTLLAGGAKAAVPANADAILLKTIQFDSVPTAVDAPVLVRDAVVNKQALDYGAMDVAAVDAQLLTLGIVPRDEPENQGLS